MEPADPWWGLEQDLHQQWWECEEWVDNYKREEGTMGRFSKDSGGNFTPAPAGTHVARCIKLIDLGTQTGEYQGKPTVRNQVLVMWELPNELMDTDDGKKPFVASKFYTNSLHEKASLRADLEAWRGKQFNEEELESFDLMSVLTKPCMLSIVGKDGGGTKIASVAALPKGTECPAQFNLEESFWLDEFSQAVFDSISKGIQDIIKKSPEYQAAVSGNAGLETMDDDIPF